MMPPEQTTPFDPNDSMQVALKIVQQDGVIASMQQAMTATNQNLANAIQGLQAEVRDLGKGISVIGKLENDRQSHSEGLARAFEAIAKLSAMHEQAWERHQLQEVAYRERVATEHDRTRSKMLRWSGGSIAATVFIGAIVGLVVWIYTTDKSNNERDIDLMRTEQVLHAREADLRFDKIEGVLIRMCAEKNQPCQFR